MRKAALVLLLSTMYLFTTVHAYFNVTYLNTTVILNKNTSAHVVESLTVFVSNSSITQYEQDRRAINLTLSEWQRALSTSLLVEHIINPKTSISRFTFLPGSIGYTNNYGGTAVITMSYYVNNITSVQNTGPRVFEYTFNDTVLNFQHSSSGQQLPSNTRLNIIIPEGTEAISVYPSPDFPNPSFTGNYSNHLMFSWYESEPLTKFAFSYTQPQSMESEVIDYFSALYANYTAEIYLLIAAAAIIFGVYVYTRVK